MPFREISGHRTLLSLVSRAIARDSIPPSLLLTGADGVGKHLTARVVAEVMNCRTPVEASDGLAIDSCGGCNICNRIQRWSYPDVIKLEPTESGSITVDQMRAVLGQVGYKPFEARRRVVFVDDADMMVAAAQNALLKTLEEPNASTQMILVTSRPDLLLDTVRSRCPKLRFGLLDVEEIIAVLTQRVEVDEVSARSAAVLAGGSAGRAIKVASGELAESRQAALGLLDVVSAAQDVHSRLNGAKDFFASKGKRLAPSAIRQAYRLRLGALTSLLRDIELICVGARVPLANADLEEPLKRLAASFSGGRSRQAFSVVDKALDAIERNVSPKVVSDWLSCQL